MKLKEGAALIQTGQKEVSKQVLGLADVGLVDAKSLPELSDGAESEHSERESSE